MKRAPTFLRILRLSALLLIPPSLVLDLIKIPRQLWRYFLPSSILTAIIGAFTIACIYYWIASVLYHKRPKDGEEAAD